MSVADPDELRRVAARVLDEPEFREAEPGLAERVVDRVEDLLAEFFELLGGGGAGSLLGWGTIVAATGVLVWLVVRFVPEARAGTFRAPGAAGPGATVDIAEARDPRSWDTEAELHEGAGRWDEALRARYRAVVARLARRGALRDAPAVTTGEHRSGVARIDRAPLEPDAFLASADRFDEVWYGGAVASREDVDRARRLADEVDRGR